MMECVSWAVSSFSPVKSQRPDGLVPGWAGARALAEGIGNQEYNNSWLLQLVSNLLILQKQQVKLKSLIT